MCSDEPIIPTSWNFAKTLENGDDTMGDFKVGVNTGV
jgi:hypothetical protein